MSPRLKAKAAARKPLGTVLKSGSSTLTNVASSATSVQIAPVNGRRKGITVYNDSTSSLYLKLGTGAASTTSFTVLMATNTYYEVPYLYGGVINGIWAAANGFARVTEFL
jgi:hypothetical protein